MAKEIRKNNLMVMDFECVIIAKIYDKKIRKNKEEKNTKCKVENVLPIVGSSIRKINK